MLHHVVNTLGWAALRPLQEAAVEPLLRGDDPVLLAVRQLKFADLLPPDLAHHTLAARLADHDAASRVARRAVVTTAG